MVNLYTDADYDNALKLKKKLLAIYFAVLTVFVRLCSFCFCNCRISPRKK